MWNVNCHRYNLGCRLTDGINRNIVECKFHLALSRLLRILELIETLWNVNSFKIVTQAELCAELIETLWNVNVERKATISNKRSELIETLWNVNLSESVM